MPGSSAEHLNTQNAKGLPLPAEPFNYKKQQEKMWEGEVGGRKGEEAKLTWPLSLDLTSAHNSLPCPIPKQQVEFESGVGSSESLASPRLASGHG